MASVDGESSAGDSRRGTGVDADQNDAFVRDDNDDDDSSVITVSSSISLSSTIDTEQNSDEEWSVEDILAESQIQGEMWYLLQWTGYEPPGATWEPKKNVLGPDSVQMRQRWEETKEKQKRGEEKMFDIQSWIKAQIKKFRAKTARHEKRNVLRERQGELPSSWENTPESTIRRMLDFFPQFENRDEESSDDDDWGRDRLDSPSESQKGEHTDITELSDDHPQKPLESTKKRSVSPSEQHPSGSASQKRQLSNNFTGLPKAASTLAAPDPTAHAVGLQPEPNNAVARMQARWNKAPTSTTSSTIKKPTWLKSKTSATSTKRAMLGKTAQNAKPAVEQSVNVFAGGLTGRKTRRSLCDVAVDTTKEPKIFSLRYQNMIGKASREKEDCAPARPPRKLISLDSRAPGKILTTTRGAPAQEPASEQDHSLFGSSALNSTSTTPAKGKSAGQETNIIQGTPVPVVNPSPLTTTIVNQPTPARSADKGGPKRKREQSRAANKVLNAVPKIKKRKSVHWEDGNSYHEVPEPSLFIEDKSLQLSPEPITDTGSDIMSPVVRAGALARAPTPPKDHLHRSQNVTKMCLLGPQASQSLSLVFKGIHVNTPHYWLSHFKQCGQLIFSHTCMAQDFQAQWSMHPMNPARPGPNLASGYVSSPADLSTLETAVDRLKLASAGMISYNNGYYVVVFPAKCEDWDFEPINGTDVDSLLKYIVFESTLDPQAPPCTETSNKTSAAHESQELSLPGGLNQFFELNYGSLVPPRLKVSKVHPIYLAFPPSAQQFEARFLAKWLAMSCRVESRIYSALTPGHWDEFVKYQGGIIIMHEDAMWKFRQFDKAFEVLCGANDGYYSIFVFRRALKLHPILPATKARLGDVRLLKVFPDAKVFMMTPSFMLSRPKQACAFVEWFKEKYVDTEDARHRGKLVVSADIDEWLMALLLEQAGRDPKLCHGSHNAHRENIEAWEKTWGYMHDFVKSSRKDFEFHASFLIFAPQCIDGNDEQSLVNWFGYWTIENMDQASLFYVLGSNSCDENRMMKQVKRIKYTNDTVGDPETAAERVAEEIGSITDLSSAHSQNDILVVPRQTIPNPHTRIRCQLVQTDDAHHLADYLHNINKTMVEFCPMILYNRPVSYWDRDMAYKFGDPKQRSETFYTWFNFLHPFRKPKNTYAGLFYTIGGKWDPSLPADHPSYRPLRPWLAIFRPVNPHRPYNWHETELFIWDPEYRLQLSDQERIYENDLIDAQTNLIKTIVQNSSMKFPPLAKVWLGGWQNVRISQSMNNLDTCLEFLNSIVYNWRDNLPAPAHHLPDRGWRVVEPAAPVVHPKVEKPIEMDTKFPQEEDVDPEELRIIFHPPAGKKVNITNVCQNLLFKDALKHSLNNCHAGFFDHKYIATKVWYGQQVQEGRDFKHILVDVYWKIFEVLGVVDPDRRLKDAHFGKK